MQEVFNWCLENWRILLEVVLLVLSVLFALFRKKPIQDVASWIFKYSLVAVKEVEQAGIVGAENKKNAAIDMVNAMLMVLYPNIKNGSYNSLISNAIEDILETPQKKGE